MSVLSDIIGGFTGIVSAGSSFAASMQAAKSAEKVANINAAAVDRTNQANRELAQYQNSYNYNMWKEQNAYNDPSAQMDRLRAAGINPNSIAGQSTASGIASAPPEAASMTYQAYQAPTDMYNAAIQLRAQMVPAALDAVSKLMLAKSQSEYNNAKTLETLESIPGTKADSTIKTAKAKYADDLAQGEKSQADISRVNAEFQRGLNSITYSLKEKEISLAAAKKAAMEAVTKLNNKRALFTQGEINYTLWKIKNLKSEIEFRSWQKEFQERTQSMSVVDDALSGKDTGKNILKMIWLLLRGK